MITEEMYTEWVSMQLFPLHFQLYELNTLYRYCRAQLINDEEVQSCFDVLLGMVFDASAHPRLRETLMDVLAQFVLLNRLHEEDFDMRDIQAVLVIHVFILTQLEVMHRVWVFFEEDARTKQWVKDRLLNEHNHPFRGMMSCAWMYDSRLNGVIWEMYNGHVGFYEYLIREGWFIDDGGVFYGRKSKKEIFSCVFMYFACQGVMMTETSNHAKGVLLKQVFEEWYEICVRETRISMFNCELWHRVLFFSGATAEPYSLKRYETVFRRILHLINMESDEMRSGLHGVYVGGDGLRDGESFFGSA